MGEETLCTYDSNAGKVRRKFEKFEKLAVSCLKGSWGSGWRSGEAERDIVRATPNRAAGSEIVSRPFELAHHFVYFEKVLESDPPNR